MIEDSVSFGGGTYLVLLGLLTASRGMDFLSTWLATPNLALEGNPIARWLGWRWGAAVNAAACLGLALWPFPAIVLITTSVLVAARNLQSVWLMRALGEMGYRSWMASRLAETPRGLYLSCLLAQAGLTASVGVALMWFSDEDLLSCGIGMGIVTYSVAVVVFTLLSVRRVWRAAEN